MAFYYNRLHCTKGWQVNKKLTGISACLFQVQSSKWFLCVISKSSRLIHKLQGLRTGPLTATISNFQDFHYYWCVMLYTRLQVSAADHLKKWIFFRVKFSNAFGPRSQFTGSVMCSLYLNKFHDCKHVKIKSPSLGFISYLCTKQHILMSSRMVHKHFSVCRKQWFFLLWWLEVHSHKDWTP